MSARVDALLRQAARAPLAPSAVVDLAEAALESGREPDAAPVVRAAAELAKTDPGLWQWAALLHRALDQHAEAVACFTHARARAPADALIAHSIARTSLEAGLPARLLFERARALAPANGEILLGLAAARLADGKGEDAEEDLAAVLRSNPGWIGGHETLMQLRWLRGDRAHFDASVIEALRAQPRSLELWTLLLTKLIQAGRPQQALDAAQAARAQLGESVAVLANEAAALSELGRHEEADRLFSRLASIPDTSIVVWRLRHFLRTGCPERVVKDAEPWLSGAAANMVVPYLSIAWRLLDDHRWAWLEGDERLVQVFDISADVLDLPALAERLRLLHARAGEMLDQSVRGGSQTDGNLFQRVESEVRALRAAIEHKVRDYVDTLPPPDPAHPFLRQRRDRPVRFSGAWSVRLTEGGCHANHVHPSGWISSAFYVAVPESIPDSAGWLRMGVPQAELGIDLPAFRWIEPQVGRLVLFPSTMWHGTLPFPAGERMTVAFDVAPPRN